MVHAAHIPTTPIVPQPLSLQQMKHFGPQPKIVWQDFILRVLLKTFSVVPDDKRVDIPMTADGVA